jgi:mono/diheme cytochrome c family protein
MKLAKISIFGLLLLVSLLAPLLCAQAGKGDPAAGKDVFKAKCAECHNADSKEAKVGPGFQGVKDGKLPSGAKATREVILDLVNNGQDAMPPFKDTLTERQREDVTAYVMTL